MSSIILTAEVPMIRVDKFLSEEIEFLSRTKVQDCIRNKQVLVNGETVKPSYLLAGGEIIEIILPEEKPLSVIAEDIPLDIIYEDDVLIVLNKPAGMVTHPGAGNHQGTLVNGLVFHFEQLSQVYGNQRPGIVHRLDKDTSGVLVVAKSDECHRILADQFANRTVEKKYLGLTWGNFSENEGVIDRPIIRHPQKRQRFIVGDEGRPALTEYRVIKEWDCLSLLELIPKTGRTHQIRVHMNAIQHPIFADELYGGGRSKISGYSPQNRKFLASLFSLINRQALHALSLSFKHPKTEERVSYTAPLAQDFQAILNQLEQMNE